MTIIKNARFKEPGVLLFIIFYSNLLLVLLKINPIDISR